MRSTALQRHFRSIARHPARNVVASGSAQSMAQASSSVGAMEDIPDTGSDPLGKVIGIASEDKQVIVMVLETESVVSLAVPANANMPDVGSIIYLRRDGTYTNEKGDGDGDGEKRKAAADDRSSSPPTKRQRMCLETISEVFDTLQHSRNQATIRNDAQIDIIETMGLTFKNCKGINDMQLDDEEDDEDEAGRQRSRGRDMRRGPGGYGRS